MGYRYKRTVHCSYCGGAGHNQSGCSAYKERIEQLRADFGDDHYSVRSYDEKKARKASSAKNRKCSYCGEGGHNKAGCSKLKSAMEQFRTKNVEYRKNVLNALVENGLGPGAMLRMRRRGVHGKSSNSGADEGALHSNGAHKLVP